MAEYFVAFARNMICFVISVGEVLLAPFETRVLFLGMTTLDFLCLVKIMKLAELWPRYADESLFLVKE